jgi:hypothetical protein
MGMMLIDSQSIHHMSFTSGGIKFCLSISSQIGGGKEEIILENGMGLGF